MRAGPLLLALGLAACDRPMPPPEAPAASSAPTAIVGVVRDSLVHVEPQLRYTFRVAYPRLVGGGSIHEVVNAAIADSLRALDAGFFEYGGAPPGEALPDSFPYPTTVEGGYDEGFLDAHVFSALVEVYFYTGGAHGNTLFLPLNFDLATGAPITAAALFRPDAPWADTLAARSTTHILARYGPGTTFEEQVLADPALFQELTLEADSLVVHFAPYAVAPYAVGPIRVGVAWSDLAPLLAPDGPAARLRVP